MARLVIASNRVPVPTAKGTHAGGLTVVLHDAIRAGTLWFGWSGKTASHTSKDAKIVERDGVDYATIDLSDDLYRKFYVGYANGTLWPLFHFRLNLIDFHREQLDGYRAANQAFAEALAKLVKPDDVIWVHDYHLIPLAAALRRLGLKNRIGFFLHVPFVPASVFSVLPQGEELLNDFCAYDVIGFQTETHRQDFVDCIRRTLRYPVDPVGCMSTPMRSVDLVVSPVGIDSDQFARQAELSSRSRNSQRLAESLVGRCLLIGADRLDYSKGLPNRFEAFNRLLTRFPQHRSKVSFLQIAAPSREDVAEYAALRPVLNRIAGDINARHAAFDWVPLRYMSQPLARSTLAGFYRHACVGVVTPFADGMNLVAHEFLAAQDPENPGVLLLSKFAGAASYFKDALIVNPYDPDEIAEAMHDAVVMPVVERKRRHARLIERLRGLTAANYCAIFLNALENTSVAKTAA
ncbi:MAG TPA: trehalose-6-phosphate synthase [Rhizomicrobium sp.]|nr:trehalose-6-phosphate synthase [Rhizomicrobium sp.]